MESLVSAHFKQGQKASETTQRALCVCWGGVCGLAPAFYLQSPRKECDCQEHSKDEGTWHRAPLESTKVLCTSKNQTLTNRQDILVCTFFCVPFFILTLFQFQNGVGVQ